MTTKTMTTEEELVTVTSLSPKTKSESRENYLARLCRAVSDLDNSVWSTLSKPAQRWFNNAVDAMTDHEEIEEFPENQTTTEEVAPTASKEEELEEVAEDSGPAEDDDESDDDEPNPLARAHKAEDEESPAADAEEALAEPLPVEDPPKRKRGRPKKIRTPEELAAMAAPKKRGRPKKVIEVKEEAPASPKVKAEKPAPKAPKEPEEAPEQLETERRRFVVKSRRSSKPGASDFFRELCIDNPKWDRDTLMSKALKSGFPIRPGTANVIYYEIKKLLQILAEKKLIKFEVEDN